MKIRKRKKVWRLHDFRQGTGEYFEAWMDPKDFDKVAKEEESIVIKVNDTEILFLQTPLQPIIIYRGKNKQVFK